MSVIPIRQPQSGIAGRPTVAAEELPAALLEELEAAMEIADGVGHAHLQLRLVGASTGRRLRLDLLESDGSLRLSLSACEALDLAAGRIAL